jgi:hypothetical protein
MTDKKNLIFPSLLLAIFFTLITVTDFSDQNYKKQSRTF